MKDKKEIFSLTQELDEDKAVLTRHPKLKTALFISMCVIVALISVSNIDNIFALLASAAISALIIVNNAVKLWTFNDFKHKLINYAVDFALFLPLTMFSSGNSTSGMVTLVVLYLIFLTEFYLSSDRFIYCLIMVFASILAMLITYYITIYYIQGIAPDVLDTVLQGLTSVIIIAIHFVTVNIALLLYRSKLTADTALKELAESNSKLQKANAELREMAVIQERQRIAREIHDTAGHSITTFIMQAESAKLIIDTDPAGAKSKLSAATLQARHALEELRSSVHLLSGRAEQTTLKEDLEKIISDTSVGTDINIRSDIADIQLPAPIRVFITNSLKEGLSNGMRHGGATAFYFELADEKSAVTFTLSDNGKGVTGKITEGFGLSGMRRRAEELNGKITFTSDEEEGFEIRFTLPIENTENKGEENGD